MSIQARPLQVRRRLLATILEYSQKQKNTNGLEPILTTALNGLFNSLDFPTAKFLFGIVKDQLRRSEFAKQSFIPVFDPATSSVTVYAPSQIFDVDPTNALIENFVNQRPPIAGPPVPDPPSFSSGSLGASAAQGSGGGLSGFDGNYTGGTFGNGNLSDLFGNGTPSGAGPRLGTGGIDTGDTDDSGDSLGSGLENPFGGLGSGPYSGFYGSPFVPSGGGETSDVNAETAIGAAMVMGGNALMAAGTIASPAGGLGLPLIGAGACVGFVGMLLISDSSDSKSAAGSSDSSAAGSSDGVITIPEVTVEGTPTITTPTIIIDDTPEPDPPENPEEYPDPDSVGPHDEYPNPEGPGTGGPAGSTAVAATVMTGPGIMARAIQIGPQTIALR